MMTLTSASRKNTRKKKWNNINTWDNKHTLRYGLDVKRKKNTYGLRFAKCEFRIEQALSFKIMKIRFHLMLKIAHFRIDDVRTDWWKVYKNHQVSDVDT